MTRETTVFFVLKGLLNGEEGVSATTCAGELLPDGWYFLLDGDDDPTSRIPYASRDAAERAAKWGSKKRKGGMSG